MTTATENTQTAYASHVIICSSDATPTTPEVEGEGVVTGFVFGSVCPALQIRISE